MKERTRDLLEEIRPFFEDERAKFIVGPRYSGKTAFLSQIARSLEGKKVHASHILHIDFGGYYSYFIFCSRLAMFLLISKASLLWG